MFAQRSCNAAAAHSSQSDSDILLVPRGEQRALAHQACGRKEKRSHSAVSWEKEERRGSPSAGSMETAVKLLLRVQTNLSSSCHVVANARWAPGCRRGILALSAAHASRQAEVKHRPVPWIKILREALCLPTAQCQSWKTSLE